MAGELRLVQDAEKRRHGTIDATTSGFEGRTPRVVDGDDEPGAGSDPAKNVDAPVLAIALSG